jgi:hypothetical protein
VKLGGDGGNESKDVTYMIPMPYEELQTSGAYWLLDTIASPERLTDRRLRMEWCVPILRASFLDCPVEISQRYHRISLPNLTKPAETRPLLLRDCTFGACSEVSIPARVASIFGRIESEVNR